MPVIASTMYRHYAKGPPAKTWTLTSHIIIAVLRNLLVHCNKFTVEEVQKASSSRKLPIPSNISSREFLVPKNYRDIAGNSLKKALSPADEKAIDWDWEKDRLTSPPINGEWLESKGDLLDPRKDSTILYLHGGAYYIGSYGLYRQFLSNIIKHFKGRVCAIDYRLAPQHPFPAAVEDALATYLYLIDPPKEANLKPIDPKKIVIAGDSAGGGLSFALLMAIRDAGLPAPAGAMTLSPWMDLTHSLPSILSNIMTDYLPPSGFKHAPSPALDYAQLPQREDHTKLLENAKAEAKSSSVDAATKHTENDAVSDRKSIGPFGEAVPTPGPGEENVYRVQFYASNDTLKLPLVSPIFDRKHLRGLPPILVQCGGAERLRDESIFSTLMATNTFPGADEESLNYGKPTQVALEIYEDQPHVFQILFAHKPTSRSIKSLAAFARDVTNSPEDKDEKLDVPRYVMNDTVTIKNVSHKGKITDVTKDVLESFTKEEWSNWIECLNRTSLKDRMNDISRWFANTLKETDEKPIKKEP
ncbi:Alpha/Beta hydrolase protein [Mucor mucedo]|uniref:Alpha/Beta hydrolase protein n=1 Tax=Mucor mucedo TaxID=29922 RepID=UPI00221E823A|nr:Alpha/Beta hydrolase protein [Mucor mucedo]KAI7891866.1 Alpha/Beta hydrolase protein [Mucor mucedo]